MPVLLEPADSNSLPGDSLKIGLINNMADEALKATERQYISLFDSASERTQVRLSFYTLPGTPRNDASSRHIAANYSSIDDLWDGQLDGLIVTGREPLAADLSHEPYWESFLRTLEWAEENAHSTVWSCLAAHAAVFAADGIGRVKRKDKLFGIFECERAADHPLTAGVSSEFRLPHSRWNGLSEASLAACGYSVLTRTAEGEIDTFVQNRNKLFVFFQGHPEYESDTLLREYRRDIGRYFRGETGRYPPMPEGYFDCTTADKLRELQLKTSAVGSDKLLDEISVALGSTGIDNTWHSSARTIYSNWLRYLREQKRKTGRPEPVPAIATISASLVTSSEITQPRTSDH
jgi:homoserine O-succinyltransferase/O-acetyltransferase